MKRLLAAALLTLCTSLAFAATVAERSPFTQGLWWDPTRAGNGFDIFNVGDEVMVLWYTYEASGKPVWYAAQGSLRAQPAAPLTVLRYTWANGRRAAPTPVGTLRLDVKNPEAIEVSWTLGAAQGKWAIRPFYQSGVVNEVDHSGTWFDPSNPGWGFSLTDQGDVLGAIIYTYDAAGTPTWLASFGHERSSLDLHYFDGACPACTYRASSSQAVGRLAVEYRGEWDLTLRGSLGFALAAGVQPDGARVTQLSRPASIRAADRELAAFADSASLKAYLDMGMMNVPSTGVLAGGFSSPAPATTYSTTNLQESGVDEADLVKTDGRYIYTFAASSTPALRVADVGLDASSLTVAAPVALQGASGSNAYQGLYLEGQALVALASTRPIYNGGGFPPTLASPIWQQGKTYVEVLSRAVPMAPSTVWRAEIDGYLISSRRVGNRVYLVTRFVPSIPGFAIGSTYAPTVEANRQLLAATPLAAMLPGIRVNGGSAAPLVSPASTYAPPLGDRPAVADLIVVVAIDLTIPRVAETLAIVGMTETMYASTTSLYLATTRSTYRTAAGALLPAEPPFVTTDIHKVSLAANAMTVAGTGSVEGFLGSDIEKAAFRMSEHAGQLRVVSSSASLWNGTKNRLTVLEPSALAPGKLRTVSFLPNAARPQPIGKPNEFLYSTRFAGDRLYAVTFYKVDPLYVIDLANSADPRIAGELSLPGFSEYLHPLPNGLLLGFGKEATPATVAGDGQFAWFGGLQLTLFDVSDANKPREMQRLVMGKRGSDSALLSDHHAFSSVAKVDGTTAIAIPARIHDGTAMPVYGNAPPMYNWQESGLLRFELRGSTPADATLVQLPGLVTHSTATTGPYGPSPDPGAYGGRSVLFGNAAVFVGSGRFWRQGAPGNSPSGPF